MHDTNIRERKTLYQLREFFFAVVVLYFFFVGRRSLVIRRKLLVRFGLVATNLYPQSVYCRIPQRSRSTGEKFFAFFRDAVEQVAKFLDEIFSTMVSWDGFCWSERKF